MALHFSVLDRIPAKQVIQLSHIKRGCPLFILGGITADPVVQVSGESMLCLLVLRRKERRVREGGKNTYFCGCKAGLTCPFHPWFTEEDEILMSQQEA